MSNEQSPVLTPVGSIVTGIKALKADPARQILVGAIVGPATEYTVTWRTAPVADTGPWPQIRHSCGAENAATSFADPAVRIAQFVQQFGANGTLATFCQANYGETLHTMATRFGQVVMQ
jgi:hypothetical protein